MSSFVEIKSSSHWEQHLNALPKDTLVVAYFYMSNVEPCKNMRKFLETLALEYPVTNLLTSSWVSIDAEDVLLEKYDVTAVPFLVLQRNGEILETVSGSNVNKVREAIEAHAKSSYSTNDADIMDSEEQKKALFNRLGKLVKAAPVMVFMKGTPDTTKCGFSTQMVLILREHSVKYGFFNILADDEVRQGLKEFADWPTYPQLWVNGELVGGLDIVKEEFKNDSMFLDKYSTKEPPVNSATA